MSDDKKPDLIPEFAPILRGKMVVGLHDDAATKLYPTLMELIAPKIDEHRRMTREPGIISIRVDGASYRVTVVCPSEGLQTSVMLDTLVGHLDQLEKAIRDGQLDWVPTVDAKKRAGRSLRKLLDS